MVFADHQLKKKNMKKTLFVIIVVLNYCSYATNYFVSNLGNDSNDGLTESTAWKTLKKVNDNMNIFSSGDIIAFKGGDLFYGSIIVNNRNGITFTSYGTGKATLTGGKEIEGWTNIGNNIWESPSTDKIHQVFKDKNVLSQARYPKIVSDFSPQSNYYKITSKVSNTIFKCTNLIGFPNLVGASAQIQGADWRFTSCKIIGFNSSTGQVTLSKAPSNGADVGDFFFVINDYDLMDSSGEWVYENDKLFINSISTPTNIIGNTLDAIGIDINGSDNILITGLSFKYYTKQGIKARKSNFLKVENNEFIYCYETGVYTIVSLNSIIENNYFKGGMQNAIDINHNQTHSTNSNSNVNKNTIYEHGILKQATARNFDIVHAIRLHGMNHKMSYNTLEKIGYNGVRIYGSNTNVENNFIKDFCLTAHDGGAIYSQSNTFSGTTVDGSIIKNNIITNRDLGNKWFASGIYNDDRSKNMKVIDNTISNTYYGVFLHNTKGITLKGNHIYNSREEGLSLVEDSRGGNGEMVNNVITNNEFFLLKTNVPVLKLRNGNWNHYDFGSFNDNKYWNPYFDKMMRLKTNSIKGVNKTLTEWQGLSGQDSKSNKGNLKWSPQTPESRSQLVYNKEDKNQNKNLNGIWEDLNGNQYNGSINLEPYTSKILILIEKGTSLLKADAGKDVFICNGSNTILEASGGSSYEWSNGETTKQITVSPESTKTYTVTVSDGSISDIDDVIVTVNNVTANAGSDKIIEESESIKLTASGGSNFKWSTGATTKSIIVSPSSTKNYTVIVNENGCEDTAKVKVTVNAKITNPSPAVAFAGDDISICLGESVVLNGSGGDSYIWSTGDTNVSINVNPKRTTTYKLTASRGGKSDVDTVTISVENCNISSLPEKNFTNDITVYPNPSKGLIKISVNELNNDLNLELISLNGSLVYKDVMPKESNGYYETNLSNLNKGVYFVRLFNADQYLVKKIVLN